MTNPDEVIAVDTEALRAAAESLAAGAQHLQEGLKKLDAEVLEMLGAWTGVASGSYRRPGTSGTKELPRCSRHWRGSLSGSTTSDLLSTPTRTRQC